MYDSAQAYKDTGLLHARFRMYSVQLGRFVNRDPLDYIDGYNTYAAHYVPNAVDPFGLYTIDRNCCCKIEAYIKGANSAIYFINSQIGDGQTSINQYYQNAFNGGFGIAGLAGIGALGGGRPACVQEALDRVEKDMLITFGRYVTTILGGGFGSFVGTVTGGPTEGAANFMTMFMMQELVAHKAYLNELLQIERGCKIKFPGCCGDIWRAWNCMDQSPKKTPCPKKEESKEDPSDYFTTTFYV